MARVDPVVVVGGGARWIRLGVEEFGNERFGNVVFHLDGFHLSWACGIGYGGELGRVIYCAIGSGDAGLARASISAAPSAQTQKEISNRRHVESNVVCGVDWRNRGRWVPETARSLGTMECN